MVVDSFPTYLLLVEIIRDVSLEVGARGKIDFARGWYVYVGSGGRNLMARLRRHLRREKKLFWHIDYLLASPAARLREIWTGRGGECTIARRLPEEIKAEAVDGFGCSDCRCLSHLFLIAVRRRFDGRMEKLGFEQFSGEAAGWPEESRC